MEQYEHLLVTMRQKTKILKEELELAKDERSKAIRTLEEVCEYNLSCLVSTRVML